MASQKKCEEALDLHADLLSALSNVVGLGVVPETDRGSSKRFALAVYVKQKLPSEQLDPGDVVPKTLEVPGRGRSSSRVKTRVIEQGEVTLEVD